MPQTTEAARPPLPPFTAESAAHKVRMAEDGWNSRDPKRVALAYTPDSRWRNRAEFPIGRDQIVELLGRKWVRKLDYRLIKELWVFTANLSQLVGRCRSTARPCERLPAPGLFSGRFFTRGRTC